MTVFNKIIASLKGNLSNYSESTELKVIELEIVFKFFRESQNF